MKKIILLWLIIYLAFKFDLSDEAWTSRSFRFVQVDEINRILNQTSLSFYKNESFVGFYDVTFNDALDLANAYRTINNKDPTPPNKNKHRLLTIVFESIGGFRVDKTPFYKVKRENSFRLHIDMSLTDLNDVYAAPLSLDDDSNSLRHVNVSSSDEILKSYYNNMMMMMGSNLTSEMFENYDALFRFDADTLVMSATNRFDRPFSVLLFKNAYIYMLMVFKLTNTTIRKYYLHFVDLDDESFVNKSSSSTSFINCKFVNVKFIGLYNIYATNKLLNSHIYAHTQSLQLSGKLMQIDQHVFKSLLHLKRLRLALGNYRQFWHMSSHHSWLADLNSQVRFDWLRLLNATLNESDRAFIQKHRFDLELDGDETYSYPDEDLCLFRSFPNENLVLPEFSNHRRRQCTCLFYHLNRLNYLLLSNRTHVSCVECHQLKDLKHQCTLERFESEVYPKLSRREMNPIDVEYIFEWIELIGPIITFPVVSSIGLLTNLLVIVTIKRKKNKHMFEDNQRMFDFMTLNSAFNVVECLLSSFSLLNECLGNGSLYCSSHISKPEVINFRVFGINYLGDVMKTCSILTMLNFSLERLIATSTTSTTSSKLKRLQLKEIKIKYLALIYLALSALLSYCKLREYNRGTTFSNSNENIMLYIRVLTRKIDWLFLISYLVHYLLNDLVLLLLNLIVDALLVWKIRAHLSQKRKFAAKSLANGTGKRIASLKLYHKRMEEIHETEKNSNEMIIFTLVVYSLCRLPELLLYIYFLTPWCPDQAFSTYAPILINIIQYMYALSYTTNLFFYFNFNRTFRQVFRRTFF